MTSSRNGNIEVQLLPPNSSLLLPPDSSLKKSNSSSDGFRSPSPLPTRPPTHSGNAPHELIKLIQTEGTEVCMVSCSYVN